MKNNIILILLLIIVPFSCVNIKRLGTRDDCIGVGLIEQNTPLETVNGKVLKIITLNNYYIVYVQSENKTYKILSYIQIDNICHEIQLDSNYTFILQIMKHSLNPEVTGINIGEAMITYQEGDSIRGLYFAKNLTGLCLSYIDTLQISPCK